jgi:hypothetical protein
VGPVGPPAHLGRPVDLDVLDDEVVGVQPLVLRVALRILQHVQKEFSRLVGPPADSEHLRYRDLSNNVAVLCLDADFSLRSGSVSNFLLFYGSGESDFPRKINFMRIHAEQDPD